MKKLSLAMLSLVAVVGSAQAADWQATLATEGKHAGRTAANGAYLLLGAAACQQVVWPYLSSLLSNLPGAAQKAEAEAAKLAASAESGAAKLAAAGQAGWAVLTDAQLADAQKNLEAERTRRSKK